MQNPAWVSLLRRIPPAQHQNLLVMTTIGVEVALQSMLRLDEEFLVIRGRLKGSTDTGRVFFIPYDQINYIGFQKPVKESVVEAVFSDAPAAAAPAAAPGEAA